MDYRKYNNALEKAKVRYNEIKDTNCNEEKFLLELFPELKESEDERIRKRLIEFFEDWGETKSHCWGINVNNILTWLEKQKSVGEIVERCKNSWYKEGKIAGMLEGLTNDEKYQQGWHDALEKQGEKNPTWSEDDEEFYNDIIKYFSDLDYSLSNDEDDVINWLKSLKERLI